MVMVPGQSFVVESVECTVSSNILWLVSCLPFVIFASTYLPCLMPSACIACLSLRQMEVNNLHFIYMIFLVTLQGLFMLFFLFFVKVFLLFYLLVAGLNFFPFLRYEYNCLRNRTHFNSFFVFRMSLQNRLYAVFFDGTSGFGVLKGFTLKTSHTLSAF